MSGSNSATHIQQIREWVTLDQEIQQLKMSLKSKKKRHGELMARILETMSHNSVDSYNIKDGALVRKQRKAKAAISKKYLVAQLNAYYAHAPEEGSRVADHLLNNRGETTRQLLECKLKPT